MDDTEDLKRKIRRVCEDAVEREKRLLEEHERVAALTAEVASLHTAVEDQRKRAEDWRSHADTLRCQACGHPHGRIAVPKGMKGMGLIWVCPCDCHADVPALKEEIGRLRRALAPLSSAGRDLMRSFEAEMYVRSPKPEEEHDEYDHMMAPLWRSFSEALPAAEAALKEGSVPCP